jgi:hypothetical protein
MGSPSPNRRPRGDRRTIQLGLVVTPLLGADVVQDLGQSVALELRRRVPDVSWDVSAVPDALVTPPASTNDWCRWVGDVGEAIGMQSFGASGPADARYKHFGLTAERVALAGRRSVRRARERVRVR